MLASLRTARGRQRGSSLVELTVLTVVLLIPVVYLMVTALDMQRGAYAVAAAARAGARAYNIADGSPTAAMTTAVDLALSDQHALPWKTGVQLNCSPPGCRQPGSFTTVRVDVRVPLPLIPDFIGGATSISFHSSNTSPYGQYKPAG
jgi:hypothetical protein